MNITLLFLGTSESTVAPVTSWDGSNVEIAPGETLALTVLADRTEGEELTVQLDGSDLPAGLSLSSATVVIPQNADRATVNLIAAAGAADGATGDINILPSPEITLGTPTRIDVTVREGGVTGSALGIVATGRDGSTVHQFANNTLAENKALFVDAIRAAREPRPGQQQSFTSQNATAPSFLDTGFLHKVFASWSYNTGAPGFPATLRADNQILLIDNCEFFLQEPQDVRADGSNLGSKWCMQSYNQPAGLTRNTDFESIKVGPVGYYNPAFIDLSADPQHTVARYPHLIEHGQYWHSAFTLIWKFCTSRFLGGHPYYIANRPFTYEQYAPDNVPTTKSELALVDNCHFIDSNVSTAKGSNAVEIFDFGLPEVGKQSYLVVRNSSIIDAYDFWIRPVG
ncbi:MAG: hypothetical protein AAGG01_12220, partial [Planctomycetota bacterium]